MTESPDRTPGTDGEDFARKASEARPGLLREYWAFLREEKKWWLAPLLISLLVAMGFVVIGGSSIAPLIYALF